MDLDGAEWGQLTILVAGSTEPATLKLFEKLLNPGDIVFDIGAHVGHHALVASRAIGPKGRVYAFDPQPYNVNGNWSVSS
jgi:23S rRNA U2552 (ribose-2'-O)-methylase RlmE/FtsJ